METVESGTQMKMIVGAWRCSVKRICRINFHETTIFECGTCSGVCMGSVCLCGLDLMEWFC